MHSRRWQPSFDLVSDNSGSWHCENKLPESVGELLRVACRFCEVNPEQQRCFLVYVSIISGEYGRIAGGTLRIHHADLQQDDGHSCDGPKGPARAGFGACVNSLCGAVKRSFSPPRFQFIRVRPNERIHVILPCSRL